MRWLVLRLEAPMMAFGDHIVDERGTTDLFPALSAITGLLGNAAGIDRSEGDKLQKIQDTLILASRIEPEGTDQIVATDFQTAQLSAHDRVWTPDGPAIRAGGMATYDSPAILRRDYVTEARVTCALGFQEGSGLGPELVGSWLDRPARPLFIGRKPCIPSRPLRDIIVEAKTPHEALKAIPGPTRRLLGRWPVGTYEASNDARVRMISDLRDWRRGVHAGARQVAEGAIIPRVIV